MYSIIDFGIMRKERAATTQLFTVSAKFMIAVRAKSSQLFPLRDSRIVRALLLYKFCSILLHTHLKKFEFASR